MSDQLPLTLYQDAHPPPGITYAYVSELERRLVQAAEAPDGEAAVLQLLEVELSLMPPFHRMLVLRTLLWDALDAWCASAVRALLRAGGRIWAPRNHGGTMVQEYERLLWDCGCLVERVEPTERSGKLLYDISLDGPQGPWYGICRKLGPGSGGGCPTSPRLAVAALLEAGAPTTPLFACAKKDLDLALALLRKRFSYWVGVQYMDRFLFWSEQLYARAPEHAGPSLESAIRRLHTVAVSDPEVEVARLKLMSRAVALLCALGAWSPLRRSWISAVMRATARR